MIAGYDQNPPTDSPVLLPPQLLDRTKNDTISKGSVRCWHYNGRIQSIIPLANFRMRPHGTSKSCQVGKSVNGITRDAIE
mmetsp:Transcript_17735/g.25913  ORF Transcript_17735/g.25913 Transcript_17735/m.25913 type:complete len:80 (-) Transcript_17735:472-711(-)